MKKNNNETAREVSNETVEEVNNKTVEEVNNEAVEEINGEHAEKVSGGYSQRYKDRSGKFKVRFRDRLLGYKSKDVFCDFCGKKFTTEGIFKLQGKDACENCYRRLKNDKNMVLSDDQILGK